MLLSILFIIIDLDDNYGLLAVYNGEALSKTQLSSDNGIYSITVPNGVSALEENENMWWIWLLAILSSAGGVGIYK